MRRFLPILVAVLAALWASAALAKPRIEFFRVVPVEIHGGRWYGYQWKVRNASRVRLFEDSREIESRIPLTNGGCGWPASKSGSYRRKLRRLHRYQLIAEDARGGRPACGTRSGTSWEGAAPRCPAPSSNDFASRAPSRSGPRSAARWSASALDPLSTLRVEELIHELKTDYTVVIVTHNMQQAARVSGYTAFLYLGRLIELDDTTTLFTTPSRQETEHLITGRYG